MTKEELSKLSPEEVLEFVNSLKTEANAKDGVISSLTEQVLSSSSKTPELILKLGKKKYKMNYSKIQQVGENGISTIYSYEDLAANEKIFAKVLENDLGSFTEL